MLHFYLEGLYRSTYLSRLNIDNDVIKKKVGKDNAENDDDEK